MKITEDNLHLFTDIGIDYLVEKVKGYLDGWLEHNDDESSSIFINGLAKSLNNTLSPYNWLKTVIPIMNSLNSLDFFGTEGWEHHCGLED